MGEAERAYAVFESKVTRTVYLDNLSPQATEAVIKSAIEQYGTVIKVEFILNYTEPNLKSCSALVELEKAKQAVQVIDVLNSYPFMISRMPRPVRACHAEEEMFVDRPPKPGRRIKLCWLNPVNPDFVVAMKLKKMARKHLAESAYLDRFHFVTNQNVCFSFYNSKSACYQLMQLDLGCSSMVPLFFHLLSHIHRQLFVKMPQPRNLLCSLTGQLLLASLQVLLLYQLKSCRASSRLEMSRTI